MAALGKTQEFLTYLAIPDISAAGSLGNSNTTVTIISHSCNTPESCCTQTISLFNLLPGFDVPGLRVDWFNQQPPSAIINDCGSVTVHAVYMQQYDPTKAAAQISRKLNVFAAEFVWKVDESFRYACGQNPGCGLYLDHLSFQYVDCPADSGPCSEC